MLTKTYALRLYQLPPTSQPLKWLQGPWSEPTPNDLPLPTPQRKAAKTVLRWLATQVAAHGPRIKTFPPVQQAEPTWTNRVSLLKEGPGEIMAPPPRAVIIYCQGIFTSRGAPNGKPRGTAAATLHVGDMIWGHTSITLRESITK